MHGTNVKKKNLGGLFEPVITTVIINEETHPPREFPKGKLLPLHHSTR